MKKLNAKVARVLSQEELSLKYQEDYEQAILDCYEREQQSHIEFEENWAQVQIEQQERLDNTFSC